MQAIVEVARRESGDRDQVVLAGHERSESTPDAPEEQVAALIERAERLAKRGYDGHLAILRFTGGWKCVLGTPQFTDDLSLEDLIMGRRGQIERLEAQPTAEDALRDLLVREST